jgi:hypothetical protein
MPYSYNQVIRRTLDSQALIYVDRQEGVHNLWLQPLDGAAPTQITNFTEDAIFYYDWLDDEGLRKSASGTFTSNSATVAVPSKPLSTARKNT